MRVWNDDVICNTPDITIHCRTKEEAEELLRHLDELGIEWSDGEALLERPRFGIYGSETCYYINRYRRLEYCDLGFFRNPRAYVADDTTNYNIVEFDEVFCEEGNGEPPVELLDFLGGFAR